MRNQADHRKYKNTDKSYEQKRVSSLISSWLPDVKSTETFKDHLSDSVLQNQILSVEKAFKTYNDVKKQKTKRELNPKYW